MYCKATMRSSRSLLQADQPKPSQTFSQEWCSRPLIISVSFLWTHPNRSTSFLSLRSQGWMQYRLCLKRAEQNHLYWPAGYNSLLFSVIFPSTILPKTFSEGLLPAPSTPSLFWHWGLSWPRCSTLHLWGCIS